jgi:hypothetical protein
MFLSFAKSDAFRKRMFEDAMLLEFLQPENHVQANKRQGYCE